ncbi:MAG TPA: regulatory protein RecX, partial [Candidatus Omnitrophota bacterium]|nr:regulatory protein RecX [Candidatus Omnitrophota bacterium]
MAKTLAEEQTKQALITALRLLAASPKSDQELRKKLAAKGYPREILERAINELKAQGVLDDRVYAKDLMARLTQGKAAGRYRVAFELKRHGVPQKIREELLDTLTDEAETERALEQARLKWVGWS